jgi:predicted DNA-binding protein (UPF0251 family)
LTAETPQPRDPRKPLTKETVEAIRAARAAGQIQKWIALRFNVSESCVSRIVNGSRHRVIL